MLLDIVTCVWQIPFLPYEFPVGSVGSLSCNLAVVDVWVFPCIGFASLNLGEMEGEDFGKGGN